MVGLINREKEIARLSELWAKDGPALGLIYGRRRTGKTFFVQQLLGRYPGIYFLAAESSSQENLEELLDQVRRVFPNRQDITSYNYPGWRSVFRLICDLATDQSLLLVLDEFSYLCHIDPSIPSVIQAIWDNEAKKTKLKLILCGSEFGVMARLDEYGKPLYGRFDCVMHYHPLDYYDAARFLTTGADKPPLYSARDSLQIYGLFGGSGRNLDSIDPQKSLAWNASNLLLAPLGPLNRDGENLIRQEKEIRGYSSYNAVLAAIARGATELGEITNQAHVEKPSVQRCLERLQQLEWIAHEKPFEEPDRRGVYKLKDNFMKSWYRFVFRYRSALQVTPPANIWTDLVEPDLDNYMGSQVFEGICAQHLTRFGSIYGLPVIIDMGRWWSRSSDLEIDIVVRYSDGSYLFGECKWSTSPMDVDELGRIKGKVEKVPHGRWRQNPRFVLFSAGGFTQRLVGLASEQQVLLVGPDEFFCGLS